MSATYLGILAGIVSAAAISLWVKLLREVRVPRNRLPFLVTFAGAALLGIYALGRGANWLGSIGAVIAILVGFFSLVLRAQSAQAAIRPSVSVGGEILDFTACDDAGQAFNLSSLHGSPFLLKFFRGHW